MYHSRLAPYGFSQFAGFTVGLAVNYPLSKYVVFGDHGRRFQLPKFVATAVIGLGANELVLNFSVRILHFPVLLGMALGFVAGFLWNFTVNRLFVFLPRT